MTVGELKE